jgi:stage IV sporulation protein FB
MGATPVLLGEPQRTQWDLHFSLFGLPVRIHPFFWLVAFLLGPWKPLWGRSPVPGMLIWVAALTLSIFIHELGHALAMRWYGFRPAITLYGMGGLASYGPAEAHRARGSETVRQVLISLAGPGAGFLLAAVVFGAVWIATRELIGFDLGGSFGITIGYIPIKAAPLCYLVYWLMAVSLVWGAVNLLPVYPLDGGQIAREIWLAISPRGGIRASLLLSTFTAAAVAVIVLVRSVQAAGGEFDARMIWVPALFGYLAYASFATLQAYDDSRGW